jgi:hypothetical protein
MAGATMTRNPQDAETVFHEALGRWAQEHARRYGDDITVLPYEPAHRPEQHIETFKTSAESAEMPPTQLGDILRAAYERILGIEASEAMRTFSKGVGLEIRELLLAGRNVAILTAHADKLHDIGTLCGGIAVCLGRSDLIQRNGTLLSKVMSRERFRGVAIAQLFSSFGNVYWVIPESDSAQRWGVTSQISRHVNSNAIGAVLRDMRNGIVLTFAPSGSAMRQQKGRSGSIRSLIIPRVGDGTAHLLSRFDAYVASAIWDGQIAIGPVVPLDRSSRNVSYARREHHSLVVAHAMKELAQLTEDLAGVPVRYEPDAN